MKFKIMSCSKEEYAKAEKDFNYAPVEYVIDFIEFDSEREVNRFVANKVRNGQYPKGCSVILVEE